MPDKDDKPGIEIPTINVVSKGSVKPGNIARFDVNTSLLVGYKVRLSVDKGTITSDNPVTMDSSPKEVEVDTTGLADSDVIRLTAEMYDPSNTNKISDRSGNQVKGNASLQIKDPAAPSPGTGSPINIVIDTQSNAEANTQVNQIVEAFQQMNQNFSDMFNSLLEKLGNRDASSANPVTIDIHDLVNIKDLMRDIMVEGATAYGGNAKAKIEFEKLVGDIKNKIGDISSKVEPITIINNHKFEKLVDDIKDLVGDINNSSSSETEIKDLIVDINIHDLAKAVNEMGDVIAKGGKGGKGKAYAKGAQARAEAYSKGANLYTNFKKLVGDIQNFLRNENNQILLNNIKNELKDLNNYLLNLKNDFIKINEKGDLNSLIDIINIILIIIIPKKEKEKSQKDAIQISVEPVGKFFNWVHHDLKGRRYLDVTVKDWGQLFEAPFTIKTDKKGSTYRYRYNFVVMYHDSIKNKYVPVDQKFLDDWHFEFFGNKSNEEHGNETPNIGRVRYSDINEAVVVNADKQTSVANVTFGNPNNKFASHSLLVFLHVTLLRKSNAQATKGKYLSVKNVDSSSAYYRFILKNKKVRTRVEVKKLIEDEEIELKELIKILNYQKKLLETENTKLIQIHRLLNEEFSKLKDVHGVFRYKNALVGISHDMHVSLRIIKKGFEEINIDTLEKAIEKHIKKLIEQANLINELNTGEISQEVIQALNEYETDFINKYKKFKSWSDEIREKLVGDKILHGDSIIKKIENMLDQIEKNKGSIEYKVKTLESEFNEELREIENAIFDLRKVIHVTETLKDQINDLSEKINSVVKK